MNTRRNAAKRLQKEIGNVGAPPHGDQIPPLEEDCYMEHDPDNPPPLMDENIRNVLLQME